MHGGNFLRRVQISFLSHGDHRLAGRPVRSYGADRKGERGGHAVRLLRERSVVRDEHGVCDRLYGISARLFAVCLRDRGVGARTRVEVRPRQRGRADGYGFRARLCRLRRDRLGEMVCRLRFGGRLCGGLYIVKKTFRRKKE